MASNRQIKQNNHACQFGNRAGLSLVEMLVVMGIITVLMGLVVTGLTGVQRSAALQAEAERVAGAVVEARHHAMAFNTVTEVFPEADAGEHYLIVRHWQSVYDYKNASNGDAYYDTRLKLDRTAFAADMGRIAFYPKGGARDTDGIPLRRSTFSLHPADNPEAESLLDITVSGVTGGIGITWPAPRE